ncbi:MAG: 4'-phosphopantetheinyl transferase superfamily protein [Acidobacteriota bacterium]
MIKYSAENSAGEIPVARDDSNGRDITMRPELHADEVHVWLADLNNYAADKLKLLLSADELSRAARFHFDKDRNYFIVARGLLRRILATYLDIPAGELRFIYAEKGKPSLEESQRNSLNFNLAHSHGMAIYGFSRNREVGVDLEFLREDLADEKIAERFFSPSEIHVLKGLPANLRKQAFFDCWTRKEAYIKARGEGLSMSLDEFDVSLQPGEAAALLRNHKEPAEVRRWSMQSLNVPAGFVAALVVEGHDWKVRAFTVDQIPG